MPDVKICGLTRAADASLAADLGASFVGVVFAESPRRVDAARAREVLSSIPVTGVRRAGVFPRLPVEQVLAIAEGVPLDVLQLHDDFDASQIAALRARFTGEVWVVMRVGAEGIPADREWLFGAADGIVLDALSRRGLGGTGERFSWSGVASDVERLRGRTRLVVGGGLRSENVAQAVSALRPDVVDVSSGVESAPGEKDAARLRAFIAAAGRLKPGQDQG